MKRLMLIGMLFLALAVVVVSLGAPAFAGKPVPPARCYCLDVWDPVTCSNGVTYSNSCYAQCAGATGCVPANTTS